MAHKSSRIPVSAFILLLCVPLVNALLGVIHSSMAGDIIYSVIADVISFGMYVLTALSLYAGLGYTVRACVRRICFVPYVVMYGIGLLLVYGGGIVSYRLFMTGDAFLAALPYTLVTDLLNIGIEAVLFAVTVLVVRMRLARTSASIVFSRNPFARVSGRVFVLIPVIVCVVNSFVWALASTVVDLVTVGLPVNLSEVVYLASPYLLIVVSALFGAFVVSAVMRCDK